MCKQFRFNFKCPHSKDYWRPCHKQTEAQKEANKPCRNELYAQPITEEEMPNCCSTTCCDSDLQSSHQQLREAYDGELFGLNTMTKDAPVTVDAATVALDAAAYRHFMVCLHHYNVAEGAYVVSNKDRKRLNLPLQEPKSLKVPDHFAITKERKGWYRRFAEEWENYPVVLRDKALWQQALALEHAPLVPLSSGQLGKDQLDRIRASLTALTNDTNYKSQLDARFEDLVALKVHVHVAHLLNGRTSRYHAFDYVAQMRSYQKLYKQMNDLGAWIIKNLEQKLYQIWWPELDATTTKVKSSIAELQTWYTAQADEVKTKIEELQKDPVHYQAVSDAYYKSELRHAKKLRGESTSSSMSSSSAGSFDIPSSKEREEIPREHRGGRPDERSGEQRRRRDESTGSNVSVVSASGRPPVRKKGKGKLVDRG